MNVAPIHSIQVQSGGPAAAPPSASSFGDFLAAAIDGVASAVERADNSAGALAAGKGSVMAASIERAKADVALEVVSVAASRVSGALNSLLQTQV